MGLVLDSGVLIDAERGAKPLSELLAILEHNYGETEILLSSVTAMELEHGVYRAQTPEQARKRREYLDVVFSSIPVEPFSREMAQVAARIDAESRRAGVRVPLADLMIGSMALYLGHSVGTRNLRHFQLIPDLVVKYL